MTNTPKQDWADEAAFVIYGLVSDNFAVEPKSKICERIAFDIRKARADGMRDVCNAVLGSIDHTACDARCCEMLELANKIESGQ